MDLSFSRLEHDATATALPGDLAVLLAGIATRQAMSPTALIESQTALPAAVRPLMNPPHGTFNRAVAAMIDRWNQE